MSVPSAGSVGYIDSRRAWFMWGLGVLAYTVAVMQRTSFGVASVEASARYDAGASLVSLFVVVQLLVYAAMQVPVGVLADRFGTRLVLAAGAALMCLGQLDLAFSTSLVSAIVARILVGAGDAMTFTAVLRMLPAWFSPGRIPVLNQLTGMVGQSGQLLSSIPLAAMLGVVGWTATFSAAAAASGVVAVVVLILLRNAPPGVSYLAPPGGGVRQQVTEVLRVPATRLAFWIHWMCAFWTMVFAMMWGYPFLMRGLGYPQPVASGLFTVMVIAGLPFGPLLGVLSRRAPLQRTNLALLVSLLAAVPWLAVLLWPGPAPVWLLAILVAGIAAAGPGSGIGFDVARASSPLHRIGTATGVVIVGGFFAGLVNILVVGVVLDLLGGYSLTAFRWAMATQFAFYAIGIIGAYTARAAARRVDRDRGVRYSTLWTVVRREASNWLVQWRVFRSPASAETGRSSLELALDDDRVVRVAAVLPGTGGQLVAIDVPPADASDVWWHDRVGDYLELVATEELEIGSVEVRCPDAATTARARILIVAALAERAATLVFEVTTRVR